MQKQVYILLLFLTALVACKSHKGVKSKPAWVQNRPTNEQYYVGIGIAAKSNNPSDFQQVAKKNAVNDLISEIKVTVSSKSVLSQYQNNKEFSQQFESDVKVTAQNTIEEFNVVDSWEDKDFFWIYYRLSKEEYKAAKRRKIDAAIDQAENLYNRSLSLSKDQFVQSIRFKVKALVALQPYLNEDLQTVYNGKNVYLVSELVNSIQQQLSSVTLKSKTTTTNGRAGKPLLEPIDVKVNYTNTEDVIPFLPVEIFSEQAGQLNSIKYETNREGIVQFSSIQISNKSAIQILRIRPDVSTIIKVDSLGQTLQNILMSIDVPNTSIRLNVIPVKVFLQSNEQNLSKQMQVNYLNTALKKQLADDGCIFTDNVTTADYQVIVKANTRATGNIWGDMKGATLDMSISLVDQSTNDEIYKDGLQEIKGFQTSDENAGLDAYKIATKQLLDKIYPSLKKELMRSK